MRCYRSCRGPRERHSGDAVGDGDIDKLRAVAMPPFPKARIFGWCRSHSSHCGLKICRRCCGLSSCKIASLTRNRSLIPIRFRSVGKGYGDRLVFAVSDDFQDEITVFFVDDLIYHANGGPNGMSFNLNDHIAGLETCD